MCVRGIHHQVQQTITLSNGFSNVCVPSEIELASLDSGFTMYSDNTIDYHQTKHWNYKSRHVAIDVWAQCGTFLICRI